MYKIAKNEIKDNVNKFRGKSFVLTVHGQKKADLVNLKKFFNGKLPDAPAVEKAILSKEFGKNKIHPHWQGYFVLYEQKHMKLCMQTILGHDGFHIEVAKGTENENVRYVYGVDKSYEIGWIVYRKNIKAPHDYNPQPYKFWKNFKLREWQAELVPLLTTTSVDRREIIYIYDSAGNTGKTILAEYLHIYHAAIITGGKSKDMYYAISRWQEITSKFPPVIIVDLCRSEHECDFAGIESIKNGLFFSGKYESAMLHSVRKPNVIIFSNFPPRTSNLSSDRWKVGQIVNNAIQWESSF